MESLKEILNGFDTPDLVPLSVFFKKKEIGIKLSMTGLNNPLRLLILNKIANVFRKKVLFITSTEQKCTKNIKVIL